MIVMEYAAHGDLRRYLHDPETLINWKYIICLSRWIIRSLCKIHERGFIHKDFHTGNILIYHTRRLLIADLGLTTFINEKSDQVIGVMPYIAPEVFCLKPYTPAADIYSFAMIMWEFSSQQPPFGKLAHDHNLVIEICKKHRRPTIAKATPQCWIDLMQQCWDAVPEKRPTAMQVFQKLDKWYQDSQNNIWSEDIKQIFLCDEERYKFRSMSKEKIEEHYSTHPQAIYKSRSMSHYISLMQSCQIDLNEEIKEKSINTSLNSSKKRLYSNIGLKENETGITQQIIDISLPNNSSKEELYLIQEKSERN
ncbi:kinase-like domain-containing protein [Rhizophagus diaphanus]|nr:kinase-like domain-containing protein [Rhizophagus diaphanus] [Rhizophagus sp. MUCL 43196]